MTDPRSLDSAIDPRPPRGGWAPGPYLCKCSLCERFYVGDKRSWECARCAWAEGGEGDVPASPVAPNKPLDKPRREE